MVNQDFELYFEIYKLLVINLLFNLELMFGMVNDLRMLSLEYS